MIEVLLIAFLVLIGIELGFVMLDMIYRAASNIPIPNSKEEE